MIGSDNNGMTEVGIRIGDVNYRKKWRRTRYQWTDSDDAKKEVENFIF